MSPESDGKELKSSTIANIDPTRLSISKPSVTPDRSENHPPSGIGSAKESRPSDHRNGGPKDGRNGGFITNAQDAVLIETRGMSHMSRHSGGFLLSSVASSSTHPSNQRSSPQDAAKDNKGKERQADGELKIPKRDLTRHFRKSSASDEGSLLSPEVGRPGQTQGSEDRRSADPDEILPASSQASGSVRSTNSSGTAYEGRSSKDVDEIPQQPQSVVGNNTDPLQIVNLALSLSENRRRNFTASRLSPANPLGNRRLASGNQGPVLHTPGESLRQHLQQQRQISRTASPRSSTYGASNLNSPRPSPNNHSGTPPTVIPAISADFSGDLAITASDATLARVEKARVAIELSYEFRRLLQYLPVIPPSKFRGIGKGKSSLQNSAEIDYGLGRVYNPLQYIRNRKLRLRERRPLDAEKDGWKDLDRVRGWVDTVASERENGVTKVDDRYPLPSFNKNENLATNSAPSLGSGQIHAAGPSQLRRPKLEWVAEPWDQLADSYWLHEDGNIRSIEDRYGNKLIDGFKSTKETTPRASIESARYGTKRPQSIVSDAASPTQYQATRHDTDELTDSVIGRRHDHRPRKSTDHRGRVLEGQKSRWPRNFKRSRSSSSSGGSGHAGVKRHLRPHKHGPQYLEGAALEKHMMNILKQEKHQNTAGGLDDTDGSDFGEDLLESRQLNGTISNSPDSDSKAAGKGILQELQAARKPDKRHIKPTRRSFDNDPDRPGRTSFEDLDITAPSSPVVAGHPPPFSINLSPPASPPASPKLPRKSLLPRIGSFRSLRANNKSAISERDFASDTNLTPEKLRSRDSQHLNIPNEDTSNSKNDLRDSKRIEVSKQESRSLGSDPLRPDSESYSDSKSRAWFRGGRIAELMGAPVSKVGDRLRRKNDSRTSFQLLSPDSSHASDESDAEDTSGVNSPEMDLSRATTNLDDIASRPSTNSDQPRYSRTNLPNFRSVFTRESPSPSSRVPPDDDHISRQQNAQRERGRSPRFDRLAPPRIDMRGISPSQSPTRRRFQNQSTESLGGSRGSSSSRSQRRVYDAGDRLREVLDIPGHVGNRPYMTGLASLASQREPSREGQNRSSSRNWSIADGKHHEPPDTVTKREIARVQALLLSSGVKANEICRRGNEIRDPPPPFLQELRSMMEGPIPRIPRSQEHAVAARLLVNNIELSIRELRDNAERFSNTTVEGLHDQIKSLDDRVNLNLAPLARSSADDADNFNTELTTEHTLAVKQLNDSISIILRRRRRKLRWVRRGGWVLLEWTLLGIMWWVWLIVMIVHMVRGTVRGVYKGVKWLLWL